MRILTLALAAMLCSLCTTAQTWTGNISTDWNTAGNWNGNAVPLATGNVTIPTLPAGGRWPALAVNTTLNAFTMQLNAQLNFNGFALTAGNVDIRGQLNNTNPGTDISITVSGSGTTFIRNCTVNDNIVFTMSGTGVFYDTYTAATSNTYLGNVTYNRTGTGATYIAYYSPNTFAGNLTIDRASGNEMQNFYAGATIAGNLSVTSGSGTVEFGSSTLANATVVGGTVNLNINTGSNLGIYRLINQTNGGSITISDRAVCNMWSDTLRVSSINITGNTAAFDVRNSDITGNFNYSSTVGNSSTHYIRSNIISGNVNYTLQGTHVFYDTYLANTGNVYTGNVVYNRTGTGATYICFYSANTFGGNLTIDRVSGNEMQNFHAGATIAGNLTVTSGSGTVEFGSSSQLNPTRVAGMLNLNINTGSNLGIYRLINETNGGSITISDRAVCNMWSDTLRVSAINITGNTAAFDVRNSDITGNLNYSSTVGNSSTHFIRNNTVTGNVNYTLQGTHTFYDTYLANTGNTYTGNVSYTRTSTGPLYVGFYDTVSIGGNLSFNYNVGGAVDNRAIRMTGNTATSISQDGNGPLQFYGLVIDKQNGANVTLADSVRIVDNTAFISGNLITANQAEIIWLNGATSSPASDMSKVVGPAVKIGSQAFTFPVGAASHLATIGISAQASGTQRFRAQYYYTNPHPTYNTGTPPAGIVKLSDCEYWSLQRETGANNVTVTLNYGSPCSCIDDPSKLRVARHASGSTWENLGIVAQSGSTTDGTISTAAVAANYGIFTLGTTALYAPTAVTIAANVSNPVCVCRLVTFTATSVINGCMNYQWKKNNVNVGTNSATYTDNTLANGDVISVVVTPSSAFANAGSLSSNNLNITTTDVNTWTGLVSTNWYTAGNWSCMSVPCAQTRVTIAGPTPFVAEVPGGSIQIKSLTNQTNSTLRLLNGATITILQ